MKKEEFDFKKNKCEIDQILNKNYIEFRPKTAPKKLFQSQSKAKSDDTQPDVLKFCNEYLEKFNFQKIQDSGHFL